MALIGKIRKNSWLLIVMIGIGLAGFIFMDMTQGEQSVFGGGRTSMGKVAGQNIDQREWADLMNIRNQFLPNPDANIQRASLWNYLVEKNIVHLEADNLGLGVSTEELKDLQFGQNMSPLMAQRFPSQSGQNQFQFQQQPDYQRIQEIKTTIESGEMNPEFKKYWKMQEGEIRKQRLQDKLNALVSKSIYTPTWLVEQANNDNNQRASFNYVKIPFDQVDDSEVTVSDEALQSYLTANAAKYTVNEETRKVGYIAFDVVPTAKDSLTIKEEVAKIGTRFATEKNDSLFVKNNYGGFARGWVTAETLPEGAKELAFSLPVGSVTEPYLEGKGYQITKVLDRRVLPDSAKVRHILISINEQNQAIPLATQFRNAEARIDSIKTAIENGASFSDMAAKFSEDPGSKDKGGEYDFAGVGSYVPEFEAVAFYKGDLRKMYSVRTQYGVHLIEPLRRKNLTNTERVKVAFISKSVVPSEATKKAEFNKAYEFIQNNKTFADFEKAIEGDGNLTMETSPAFKINDYAVGSLGSNEGSRNMIKMAFNTDKNDALPKVFSFQSTDDPANVYENKYVAAVVTNIQPAGTPRLENFREDILPFVKNELKGEIIKSKINSQDLSAIASSFDQVAVDTATSVNFTSPSVAGLGNEPKVVAAAFGLAANGVSSPVVGENGVYVVQLTFKPDPVDASNISPAVRNSISAASRGQVPSALMEAMKKSAAISDNRNNFF